MERHFVIRLLFLTRYVGAFFRGLRQRLEKMSQNPNMFSLNIQSLKGKRIAFVEMPICSVFDYRYLDSLYIGWNCYIRRSTAHLL